MRGGGRLKREDGRKDEGRRKKRKDAGVREEGIMEVEEEKAAKTCQSG